MERKTCSHRLFSDTCMHTCAQTHTHTLIIKQFKISVKHKTLRKVQSCVLYPEAITMQYLGISGRWTSTRREMGMGQTEKEKLPWEVCKSLVTLGSVPLNNKECRMGENGKSQEEIRLQTGFDGRALVLRVRLEPCRWPEWTVSAQGS